MLGKQVPSVTLHCRVRDERYKPNPFRWAPRDSREAFGEGRVVVFSFPAAFSPTCSDTHLPSAEALMDDFEAEGVRAVYGMAVNDAFAMYQWGRHLGIERVRLMPDGNGDFTRRMGMLVSARPYGYGVRSWRYAFVAEDGVIAAWFEEPGIADDVDTDIDPYGETAPEKVLAWLRENERSEERAA